MSQNQSYSPTPDYSKVWTFVARTRDHCFEVQGSHPLEHLMSDLSDFLHSLTLLPYVLQCSIRRSQCHVIALFYRYMHSCKLHTNKNIHAYRKNRRCTSIFKECLVTYSIPQYSLFGSHLHIQETSFTVTHSNPRYTPSL
jgi:hypothetical protein